VLKTCARCQNSRPLEQFAKTKNGHRARCKRCINDLHRAWYAELPKEKKQEYGAGQAQWREQNNDLMRKYRAAWKVHNPHKMRRDGAKRRRPKAQPKWASLVAMDAIYARAAHLTQLTGVKHEVDHVIPLKNSAVCGLHVPENLQVLPSKDNKLKGSKFFV